MPFGLSNHRYDEFLDADRSLLITGEAFTVPSSPPYYVALKELPRQDTPSTLLVRAAGTGSQINPDQDCSIYQASSGSNDNTDTLRCGRNLPVDGGDLRRCFVRFNIAALPSVASSAKLRLALNAWQGATVIGVHRVTSSWTETGPTWASQPTYDASPSSQFSIEAFTISSVPHWVECDITNLYNAWKAGTNNGLMLKADESVLGTYAQFASSEYGGGLEPQLVVVSSGNTLAELSASLAPATGQFAVHYGTGRLRFPASAAGLSFDVDYRGGGSPVDVSHHVIDLGTTGGSGTAYTVNGSPIVILRRGQMAVLTAHTNNTGACTLQINGGLTPPIKRFGAALTANQLVANSSYLLFFDGTNWQWIG